MTDQDFRVEEQEIISKARAVQANTWKEVVLSDIGLFGATYFGDQLLPFEDFHIEVLEFAATVRRGLILLPANHGKTELVSKIIPIYELCKNPNIEIILIAHIRDDGEMLAGDILRELDQNEKLNEDFGPFEPTAAQKVKQKYPWGTKAFSVRGKTTRTKDATLETFGTGSSVFGHRSHLVIGDDILDMENTSSDIQRAKVKRWLEEAVLKTLDPMTGRGIFIGTVMHHLDWYRDIEETPGWEVLRMRADWKDDKGKVHVLWPNRWPYERLMQEKLEHGSISYERRFQNVTYPDGTLKFREADVEACKDRSRTTGHVEQTWNVIISIDPAIGKTTGAKYFVATVLGIDPELPGKRYLIDGVRDKVESQRQVPLIKALATKYKPGLIVVEKNAYQEYFTTHLTEQLQKEGLYARIQPHETTREKWDFVYGVDMLIPIVEARGYSIPWKTEKDRKLWSPWTIELVEYPISKTTDCLMSLWFAELYAKRRNDTIKCVTKQRKSRWSAGRRRTIRNPWFPKPEEEDDVVDADDTGNVKEETHAKS
jgi:hypothetical protein